MKPTFARFAPAPAGGLKPSNFTGSDAFSTDDTTELNHYIYASDDESVLAGVWECAPCKEVFAAYPVNEMMSILSGSVTLTNTEDGSVATFVAGDTFFVAKGTPCVWEITETLRKYYFISE
jgi:uncharacterized cupin superfamily protein